MATRKAQPPGQAVIKMTLKQQHELAQDLACQYEEVLRRTGGLAETLPWAKRTRSEKLAWAAVVDMATTRLSKHVVPAPPSISDKELRKLVRR